MNETNWDKILAENGFSGADIVLRDFEDPDLHEVGVFVSTTSTSEKPATRSERSMPAVYIVCVDNNQAQEKLTWTLQDKMLSEGFRNCSIIDYHDALNLDLSESLCVALLGLGQIDLSIASESEFQNIKHILTSTKSLLWVSGDESENPSLAVATGLIRSARWESDYDKTNFSLLSVEYPMPGAEYLADRIVVICHRLPDESSTFERNGEFLLREGEFWTDHHASRHVE
jgi:hypothetical protein